MTNGEVCTAAIRLTGARTINATPSAAEMSAAMQTLEAMLLSVLVSGRTLTDVLIEESYEAGEDERVNNQATDEITVTLPVTLEDATTGEDRAPRNGAVVKINGTYRATYVYVSYLAGWQLISDLEQTNDQPLGPEFDEAVTAMLAVRLAPAIGGVANEITAALATQGRRQIRLQFRQVIAAVIDPVLVGNRFLRFPG